MSLRLLANALDETPIPTGDVGAAFAKMLLTFGALIFLLFATFWILKRLVRARLERGSSNSSITVHEKRMLSPKTMLYVVEIEGQRVLLAESHLEIKTIKTL